MRSTLGLSSMSLAQADASYESLIALLRGLDANVTFQIANSIWYRQGFAVEPDFLQTDKLYFDATVQGLDFGASSAATTMNAWIASSTKGKITNIVASPIDPATMMFLIDAIYFTGAWQYQFAPGKTQSQPFHLDDGSSTPVPMMDLTDVSLLAGGTSIARAVELPYGGGAFAVDVVLPNEGTTLDAVVAQLGDGGWPALLAQLSPATGDVQIPRFTLTWGATLNGPLTALGMGIAFGDDADFSGIANAGGLRITEVRQKAFVDVDEQGTTAAAATSVEIGLTSVGPLAFRADHPFLFVIRERLSGTILFMREFRRPPA